jgi:formyltetrahydrofolate deformylase
VSEPRYTARLLISCADRPGIVAGIAGFLHARGANITDSHQHSTDPSGGRFFMRLEFVLDALDPAAFERDFAQEVAGPLGLEWRISFASRPQRIGVLVSREDHCLLDLLWRWRRGELPGEIAFVASNHPDHAAAVADFGLPYHHVPVERGRKPEAEARLLELIDGRCDLVVLARYMQILSGDFLQRVGVPVINIHHSFLPAFAGAQPYQRAAERGVKIIGATAHYVTEELDAGPIIEQDVGRVTHRENIEALERAGADIERIVLLRAVRWHLEDRVLAHGNRTLVF